MRREIPSTALAERFVATRAATVRLTEDLSPEDCMVQSMPDASPVKWHLAHTTWFFETFLLERMEPGFRPFQPAFRELFNSYYQAVGPRHARPARGVLSRPSLEEVLAYRRDVERRSLAVLNRAHGSDAVSVVELGIAHEEQHQELILTDVLHHFSCNPLLPAVRRVATGAVHAAPHVTRLSDPPRLRDFAGGAVEIGAARYEPGAAFAFDNESPRHRVWLEPYALAERPVTQGEFARFIDDAGYRRPELWLSEGWDLQQREAWEHPLYWRRPDDKAKRDEWRVFTLEGLQPLDPDAPVSQLSYFEADAYAHWAGARLPTESEWENAAQQGELPGTGLVWEWTSSAYAPYPGYRPVAGALGEYNGKFMVNQMVLRGGSVATPPGHVRPSYRNFFPASARWQFSGIRLARN